MPIYLTIAIFLDICRKKIPNWLTACGFLTGIYFSFFECCTKMFLLSCAAGIGIALLLYLFRAIGGGDVKLLGVLAGFLGIRQSIICIAAAFAIAALYGIFCIIAFKGFRRRTVEFVGHIMDCMRRKRWVPYKNLVQKGNTIPFSICILAGYCAVWIWKSMTHD